MLCLVIYEAADINNEIENKRQEALLSARLGGVVVRASDLSGA